MTLTESMPDLAVDGETYALFEEARRRRRRRWLVGGAAVVAGGVVTVMALALGGGRPGTATAARGSSTGPSPAAAEALSWARRGFPASFVATYHLTGPAPVFSPAPPTTIVVAQRGPLTGVLGEHWIEPGPGEWSYRVAWSNGRRLEMVKRPDGLYSCGRSAGASWTCQGPDRFGGGNGVLIQVAGFEPVTQLYALQQATVSSPAAVPVTSTSAVVAGRRVRCFTIGRSDRWCFTAKGLLATFPIDRGPGPTGGLAGILVAARGTVPAGQFDLPSRPVPGAVASGDGDPRLPARGASRLRRKAVAHCRAICRRPRVVISREEIDGSPAGPESWMNPRTDPCRQNRAYSSARTLWIWASMASSPKPEREVPSTLPPLTSRAAVVKTDVALVVPGQVEDSEKTSR